MQQGFLASPAPFGIIEASIWIRLTDALLMILSITSFKELFFTESDSGEFYCRGNLAHWNLTFYSHSNFPQPSSSVINEVILIVTEGGEYSYFLVEKKKSFIVYCVFTDLTGKSIIAKVEFRLSVF